MLRVGVLMWPCGDGCVSLGLHCWGVLRLRAHQGHADVWRTLNGLRCGGGSGLVSVLMPNLTAGCQEGLLR